ncbi:hypothetical protein ABBQ32_000734 [Trebouxia sp. C0010 RCD-2024]
MLPKKPHTAADVERGVRAITIPASQGVSRIQELGTPRTPGSPSPLLSPSAGPEDGSPDDIVPYDAGKWDFKLTDALQVAGGFAHTFFTFYVTLAFLVGIAGQPEWIANLKTAVVYSGIAAGVVAVFGIHDALAKRNVYYKLLQHKVIIDFQQKEAWGHPLKCLNGHQIFSKCPPELTRITSFFLLWLAAGAAIVGLALFSHKWTVYNNNRGAVGWQRWGGGPWSFLAGALGAALTAYSLLSVYRGLERFYEQLLPFNVLMCSSAEDHNATAVKGWISKCVVVSEDAFQKLSRRIIYDTVQLENAYIAQLKSQGQDYEVNFLPPCCAAVKYKRMANALRCDPTSAHVEEIPEMFVVHPYGASLCIPVLDWIRWQMRYVFFLYSTLCHNDYDTIEFKDRPSWKDGLLCCFTLGKCGKSSQSTITIVFVILVFFLTVAITAGILNTQATAKVAGCADGLNMYCVATNCAPPVCPSIYSAPAPVS